jgi:hypothetical protein
MQRFTLFLNSQEMHALETAAALELRGFREQARFFIRQELQRRGLLILGESDDQIRPDQREGRDATK